MEACERTKVQTNTIIRHQNLAWHRFCIAKLCAIHRVYLLDETCCPNILRIFRHLYEYDYFSVFIFFSPSWITRALHTAAGRSERAALEGDCKFLQVFNFRYEKTAGTRPRPQGNAFSSPSDSRIVRKLRPLVEYRFTFMQHSPRTHFTSSPIWSCVSSGVGAARHAIALPRSQHEIRCNFARAERPKPVREDASSS